MHVFHSRKWIFWSEAWTFRTNYSWRWHSRHVLIQLYIYLSSSGFYNRAISCLLLIAVQKAKANISSIDQSLACRLTSNATPAAVDLFTSCKCTPNANVSILGSSVTRKCVRDTNIYTAEIWITCHINQIKTSHVYVLPLHTGHILRLQTDL
jgi:hypothetical protein